MTALPKKKKYTSAEYLALEERAEYKSEYVGGYIFKTAGGSESHIQISFNTTKLFAEKLRGSAALIKAR
jgi:Uma2 family endonuclease